MHKNNADCLLSPKKLKNIVKKSPTKKFNKAKRDLIYSRLKATPLFSEPSLDEYQPSKGLFDEEKDIEGKNLFPVTPSKPKTLNELASAENSPRSSKKSLPKVVTPKSSVRQKTKAESSKTGTPKTRTPSSQRKRSSKVENTVENKGSPHLKLRQELANLKISHVDSDPEDSDELSDYEEDAFDGETTDEEIPPSNDVINRENGSLSKRRKDKLDNLTFHESYFSAQRQKKCVTSNRTLSNLNVKTTNIEELQEILNRASENHIKHKELLLKHYKSQFGKWMLLLKKGFNILLYGIGSKQKVLNEFCKDCLDDSIYVVIQGFFPTINIKQILNTITEDALECQEKFSNANEQVQYLRKRFSKGEENLYLIFHNIDGARLRSVKIQAILSSLAAVSNIHFLCSVDHINSPLIWNQIMLSQFKWIWFDATTFEPYIIETSYEDSIFKDQSSHLLLSSLLHVYSSLTPNSQGVFRILAKYQQEQQNNPNCGIAFYEWYQECREEFLVNSEITMQAHLSEFKNHKLLTSRKSIEGIELWYIPVDSATLDQFLVTCK